MNTLPNGSIAIGAPGSIMRLLSAYEDELNKDFDNGLCFLWTRDRIPEMARKMIKAASTRSAIITKNGAFWRAARACGIKGGELAIRDYVIAAGISEDF